MNKKKLKYTLMVLAIGLVAGFAVTFWSVPENKFIPENNKAGLGTAELPPEYKYNIEQYKLVDPKLVLYKEVEGFSTGFSEATGLLIDGAANIYVSGEKGVRVFDANGKLNKELKTEVKVTAVAATKDGVLYMAMKDRVLIKKADAETRFGKKGKGAGEFEYITCMKISNNMVFIADAGNRRVSVFDLQGRFLRDFGKKNTKAGYKGFIIPSPHMDLDFDKDGNLWVANTGLLRLEKYTANGALSEYRGKAGMQQEHFIGCCNPCNFVIDKTGDFITSEKGLPRIKLYAKTGILKGFIAAPSEFNEKCVYMALAVDSKNRVYALDSVKKKVRVFEKK